MLIKILTVLFILAIFHLLPISNIFVAEDPVASSEIRFSSSYDVIFDIEEDGITTVTQKIILKNLTSQHYADQFRLSIGATDITDIKASDDLGPLQITTEQKDLSTEINVKFNQEVAGLGKQLPWTIIFKSKDFAESLGKVWEVRTPRVTSSTNLENYSLVISVPASFGEPTLIRPAPKSQTLNFGKRFLVFDKDQLKFSGVSAIFGSNQLFDFDLTYHLGNSNVVTVLTNVALPPDTAFQDVIFQRIEPEPLNVTVDDDGNYLAWYKLGRGQKIDIKVVGSAKLYTRSKVREPNLSEALRKKYTQADLYWEKDNPLITSKLAEILGTDPPLETREKIEKIYRFVVENLEYDASRIQDSSTPDKKEGDRFGAVTTLINPNLAACREFTDLFIAIARAAGIPTRELNGYAYTSNSKLRPLSLTKDILHAWPEYWDDEKGWVMVDPTWENTTGGVDYFNKLDLNHFVFVVKGLSSEYPVPAGSYKYEGQNTRDVRVSFATEDFFGKPQLDVSFEIPGIILSGLPGKIKLKVANLGNSLQQPTDLTVASTQLAILDGGTRNLGPIPAFGHADFEYNIRTKSLIESYDDTIEVIIGGQKFSKQVMIRPIIVFRSFPWILIGIIGAIGLIYFTVLGGFIYKRRSGKKTAKTVSKK